MDQPIETDRPRTLTGFPPLLYAAAAGVAVGCNALWPVRLLPRHPFFWVGLGLYAASALLAVLPPLLRVVRTRIIEPEEAYLERRFGEQYQNYKSAVRRWI